MIKQETVLKVDEVEIYENDFEIAIQEACDKFGIDDLVTVSQRRWKRVLEYVGKKIFNNTKILRDKNTVWLEGNCIPTNNNRFDYSIINMLCDYYMSLSDQYDKLISAEAFALFLNIPRETIGTWGKEELSDPRFYIYKKIKDYRLECIKDNAYDNGNVTGTMYVGNVEYNTNMPGVKHDDSRAKALTSDDVRALLSVSQGQIPEKN